MASQVKAFTDMGEYNKAIDVYKAFVDKRRAEGKLIDDIIMNYANIYLDWALELNGDEKITVLLKADKILEEAVSISKDNDVYFSYVRLKNIYFQIDGKAETGAAVPCIEQLESLILSKGKISDVNKKRLIDGYRYMMPYYAFAKNDNKKALEYANKILELDPTHDGATKFRDAMKRAHR
jgi:tetratricopeptide (TPR) repeat protein